MRKMILCFLIVVMLLLQTACVFMGEKVQGITAKAGTLRQWSLTIPQMIHSKLYIKDLTVDDVLMYFAEVCLESEYSTEEDSSMIRKWVNPIAIKIYGTFSEEEHQIIRSFMEELNQIKGFPGIYESENEEEIALRFYFCSSEELQERVGDSINNEYADGAAVFWYNQYKELYEGTICCRMDLDAVKKKSVILEEIYNILGPIQDTEMREDSIIYQYASTATSLTEVDWLILKLLYHPEIKCNTRYEACERIIRELYY